MGAMFSSDAVIMTGELSTYIYVSDTGSEVTKAFCKTCGSPIFGKNSRLPDHITLTLGTMDDANELDVQVVIFARDKPHWDQLPDDVSSFEVQPEWKPQG